MFIYIINCQDKFYKIGKAADIRRRFRQIQSDCPFELSLYAWVRFKDSASALHAESEIHQRYKEKHHWMRGEWYKFRRETVMNRYVDIAKYEGAVEGSCEIKNLTVIYFDGNEKRYYIENE